MVFVGSLKNVPPGGSTNVIPALPQAQERNARTGLCASHTDCLEVLLSVLKLCPLGFMWIVMQSSSTVDAALLLGLPEQMGTFLLCFECSAWL